VLHYTVIWGRGSTRSSTLLEIALRVAVWRKPHPVYVSRTRKLNPHCWSFRYQSQCGERLVRLSTSRADDTWGASPWESRSSPGKQAKCYLLRGSILLVQLYWNMGPGFHPFIHTAGDCVRSRSVA